MQLVWLNYTLPSFCAISLQFLCDNLPSIRIFFFKKKPFLRKNLYYFLRRPFYIKTYSKIKINSKIVIFFAETSQHFRIFMISVFTLKILMLHFFISNKKLKQNLAGAVHSPWIYPC